MKRKIISSIFIIALIGFTLWIIFSQINFQQMLEVIRNSDKGYLVIGAVCMLVFWGIEAILIDVLIKKVSPKSSFWTSVKTTLIGQYYSFITPLASGGQPAQLYIMKKDNISYSNGTAVLVSKFLLFQITVTLYSLFLTLLRIKLLIVNLRGAAAFVFIGLIINTIGLTIIILMAFKPHVLGKLVEQVISGLYRIKIVKHPKKYIEKIQQFISEYYRSIVIMKEDLKLTFSMFFATIIQLTVFFSITFFIYKALRLEGVSIIDIISLQALLYMAVSFVPIPGTVGASELGFVTLLGSVFTSNLVTVAMLLWRGISYYFGLLFCGFFSLFVYVQDKLGITKGTMGAID